MDHASEKPRPVSGTSREEPDRIETPFRNGSLTAIGVVAAFSLGFLSNWALAPGSWTKSDLIAIVLIAFGTGFQIRALAGLLFLSSLLLANYNRLIRTFLTGLVIVALGIALAIIHDLSTLDLTLIP